MVGTTHLSPSSSTDESGFVGLGIWRFRTETIAPPGSGQVRFNNSDPELATLLWINETNDSGTDVSVFLDTLQIGSLIYLQDQGDAESFILVEINSILDAGTYREFGIENAEVQGTAFTQNLRIGVIITSTTNLTPQRSFIDAIGSRALAYSDFLEPPGFFTGLQVEGLLGVNAAGGFISVPTAAYDFTDHPGVWGLNTGIGPGTDGRVFMLSQFAGGFHIGVGGFTRFGAFYQSPAIASVALNRYVIRAGFSSVVLPNTLARAVTFEAVDNENGGRWQALCEDGVAETTVDTGVTVGTSKYVFLEFEVNAAGDSVEFFIDGVSVATITTNIPDGLGFEHFINIHIMKLTGTANRASYIDAYYFLQEISR
jgi:hypothetical protein